MTSIAPQPNPFFLPTVLIVLLALLISEKKGKFSRVSYLLKEKIALFNIVIMGTVIVGLLVITLVDMGIWEPFHQNFSFDGLSWTRFNYAISFAMLLPSLAYVLILSLGNKIEEMT